MFADEKYLLLLLFIPVLAFLFYLFYKKRKKDLSLLISKANLPVLSNINFNAYKVKNIALFAGFIFLILALARPQYGNKDTETERTSSEIVLALDVSKSMLAEDVKSNRLERAKVLMSRIITEREGDKIGVIVFSSMAMWQCPMTYDIEAVKMFLQRVSTGDLPIGGTEFSAPITLAVKSLNGKPSNSRVMILITDGEDHDEKTKEAIESAKKADLRIITVGIGTAQGAPIPERDSSGALIRYVTDSNGKTVISRLDSALLQKIASETGGKYFEISGSADVFADIIKELQTLGKDSQGKVKESGRHDRFQIFLFLALIAFIIELVYPKTVKSKK
ncbi:MAG: VWA domain-containing protein [Endomicrobia bacterium]|nr:VWA domain-containing protein [Endomicrobiia bacterium]